MDTRTIIYTLVGYEDFYGVKKENLSIAKDLIRNIPTSTMLNYLAGFNVHLFQNDIGSHSGSLQGKLIDSLIGKIGESQRRRLMEVIEGFRKIGQSPLIIYMHSNLALMDLILERTNRLPSRDLSQRDAKNFFDAYLIVNTNIANRIKIDTEELRAADEAQHSEVLIIPQLIHQRDYVSTLDFTNQLNRGILLFQYLEVHPIYGSLMNEYYTMLKVRGYKSMYRSLISLVLSLNLHDVPKRKQMIDLSSIDVEIDVDIEFIEHLAINNSLNEYKNDGSYGHIRNFFLYKVAKTKFLILSINFLMDFFYKTQIFKVGYFFKLHGAGQDFLSKKAKEFMEEKYLPVILKEAMSGYVQYFGDDLMSNGKELCDFYLRKENNVMLIEFKDLLINSKNKNSGNPNNIFSEFDLKFVSNEKGKPKGITQLANAVKRINLQGVPFDIDRPSGQMVLYPIIVYTDNSMGMEGINKYFKEKFNEEKEVMSLLNVTVHDVTFINLSFFEFYGLQLKENNLDLFVLIEEYHKHTENEKYRATPFETFFSRYLIHQNIFLEAKSMITLEELYNNLDDK